MVAARDFLYQSGYHGDQRATAMRVHVLALSHESRGPHHVCLHKNGIKQQFPPF